MFDEQQTRRVVYPWRTLGANWRSGTPLVATAHWGSLLFYTSAKGFSIPSLNEQFSNGFDMSGRLFTSIVVV